MGEVEKLRRFIKRNSIETAFSNLEKKITQECISSKGDFEKKHRD